MERGGKEGGREVGREGVEGGRKEEREGGGEEKRGEREQSDKLTPAAQGSMASVAPEDNGSWKVT